MEDAFLTDIYLNEHRFWLQILGDHARLLFSSLTAGEVSFLQQAGEFIAAYDRLLAYAGSRLSDGQAAELNRGVLDTTKKFREYKLGLLALTLDSRLEIRLSSTSINHMLNELDEYVFTMNTLANGDLPIFHPIRYHLLWLSDAAGHAAGVGAGLDEAEKDAVMKSREYERQFTDLYLKSVEFRGYTRTGTTEFPALSRLNRQADAAMTDFVTFLEDLRDRRRRGGILGTLTPLMADHMAREGCYYLNKLSEISPDVKSPDGDPGRPRIEK